MAETAAAVVAADATFLLADVAAVAVAAAAAAKGAAAAAAFAPTPSAAGSPLTLEQSLCPPPRWSSFVFSTHACTHAYRPAGQQGARCPGLMRLVVWAHLRNLENNTSPAKRSNACHILYCYIMREAAGSREGAAVVVVADPLLLSHPLFPLFPLLPPSHSTPLLSPSFLVFIVQRGMGTCHYRLTLMVRERTFNALAI